MRHGQGGGGWALMAGRATCTTCGADWTAGVFAGTCGECGGGALEVSCPACLGLCGQRWRRAVTDSNDSHGAVWIGCCALTDDNGINMDWWLDEAAAPDLIWACLVWRDTNSPCVIDSDGMVHRFATMADARTWLGEDEYVPLAELRDAGTVPWDARPGPAWRDRLTRAP